MSKANALEISMLDLINAERASAGVAPLVFNDKLNDASETHSSWMLDADRFSHTGENGSSPHERIKDAGYQFEGNYRSGENIAYQSERGAEGLDDDVRSLHDGLMGSPGHRANILNPDYKEIGIGIERGDFSQGGSEFDSVMVTQNFAKSDADNTTTDAEDPADTTADSGGMPVVDDPTAEDPVEVTADGDDSADTPISDGDQDAEDPTDVTADAGDDDVTDTPSSDDDQDAEDPTDVTADAGDDDDTETPTSDEDQDAEDPTDVTADAGDDDGTETPTADDDQDAEDPTDVTADAGDDDVTEIPTADEDQDAEDPTDVTADAGDDDDTDTPTSDDDQDAEDPTDVTADACDADVTESGFEFDGDVYFVTIEELIFDFDCDGDGMDTTVVADADAETDAVATDAAGDTADATKSSDNGAWGGFDMATFTQELDDFLEEYFSDACCCCEMA